MPRLIDANKMIKDIKENYVIYGYADFLNDFFRMVEEQPTVDAVEVVRCEDCFICETRQTANYLPFLYCELHDCSVLGNFYCSWGERKEDEESV